MKAIRKLLEMAMEFGDTPDAVHPAHKRAFASGQHALGKHPAISPGAAERHASETYRHLAQKLTSNGGIMPRSPRDINRATMDMFQTLQTLQQREEAHRPQLEQIAVQVVMRLPEFKSLSRAVQSGNVKIEPHLSEQVSIENYKFSDAPTEQMPGEDVPEIKSEYEQMVQRRKMANTLAQGAAAANNYAFTNSFDELADIDPSLVRDYNKIMAYSELGFFVHDPAVMKAAAQATGSAHQGGQSFLRHEEDGSTTIVAEAITFPMLVQEIVKGCMEYLSQSDEDDPETAAAVRDRSDVIDDEQVQMQVGPSIYRAFIAAIGQGNEDLMPYVYDHLSKLSHAEYNQVMRGLVEGTPEGKNWFRNLAQQLRQKLSAQEQGESLANEMLS